MMKSQMEALDIPKVDEFLEMITAGGGEIYACKLAMDMFKLKKEDLGMEFQGCLPSVISMKNATGCKRRSSLLRSINPENI